MVANDCQQLEKNKKAVSNTFRLVLFNLPSVYFKTDYHFIMMQPQHPWLEYAKRVQALAQSGLTYAENSYDLERYQELSDISVKLMSEISGTDVERVKELFTNETGYQTPKTDVRAVIFEDNKILLVREKIDNCWSLPGTWAIF